MSLVLDELNLGKDSVIYLPDHTLMWTQTARRLIV